MSQWTLQPFKGLGDLCFGDSRQAVHALLGTNFVTFTKAPGATDPAELYDILSFHLYYDTLDGLELIEAFAPCDPMFNGVHLLSAEGTWPSSSWPGWATLTAFMMAVISTTRWGSP